MPQLVGQAHGATRPFERPIRIAEEPGDECRSGEASHDRVVAETEAAGPVPLGLEAGDGAVEMVRTGLQIISHCLARPEQEVSVDAHARVVLRVRQAEDLLSDVCRLFELGPVVVEAGQATPTWEELGKLPLSFEE